MKHKIRKVEQTDLELVYELIKKLLIELGEEAGSLGYITIDTIRGLLQSGRTSVLLAIDDNEKALGFATLTETQAIYAGGNYGVIDEMYIEPEYRSKQVGKALIDAVKDIGKQKGWNRIDVTAPTEKRWERTVQFYEREGFIFTGPKMKFEL